jgi:hypothetical protein
LSNEAERAVIGAALLDAGTLRWTSEHVGPEDFESVTLGAVYAIMLELYASSRPVDPISVDVAIRESGTVRGVTAADLHTLMQETPTAENADYYARIVADRAGKRRIAKMGRIATQAGESDYSLEEAMGIVRGEWEAIHRQSATQLESKPLGEILQGSDEYDWLIPDLLERQDRVIITGGEGGGKSTFVRQLTILPAAGIHPTTFEEIEPLKVVVVDAENTERQWRRKARGIVAAAHARGIADPRTLEVACVPRLDITREKDLGAIHRLIDKHQPDMLAIGPLYKLTPRAITSDDDAAPVINALDQLRGRDIALVMEAHAGHAMTAGGDRNLRPRGSSALLGWPEFGFGLAKDPDDPHVRHVVRWRGDRDERAWPERLRWGSVFPFVDDSTEPGKENW